MVDHLEARRHVERGVPERQLLDRRLRQLLEAAFACWLQRFPGEVDAYDIAESSQLDGGAAGAAARVQDSKLALSVKGVGEQRQRDAPHTRVPPVALFAERHDRVLLTLHSRSIGPQDLADVIDVVVG